jgi:hypothetical protein
MRVNAAAIGSVIELRSPRAGRVHSVFTHAVNLEIGAELWTVTARGGHDAAFTVRLADAVLPGDLGVRSGDPVSVRSRHIRAGTAVIDARTAVRWLPGRYHVDRSGLGLRVAELEAAARHVAWAGSWPLAGAVARALAAGCGSDVDNDLDDAVRRATGRGPGLTPSGDDVLVGILAVLTAPGVSAMCGPVAARLRSALAPTLATTNAISRALLCQAAKGHVSRPVWELTSAVLSGSAAASFSQARADVLSTGATSGGDTCAGLIAACELLSARSNGSVNEHHFALLPESVQGLGLLDDGLGRDHEPQGDRCRVCCDGVGDQHRQPQGSRARAVRRPA